MQHNFPIKINKFQINNKEEKISKVWYDGGGHLKSKFKFQKFFYHFLLINNEKQEGFEMPLKARLVGISKLFKV